VEVECDDALVIHIVTTVEEPESNRIQVGGATLSVNGAAEAETYVYLNVDAARRLREAVEQVIAILETP
jgi:hypothetical protein